MAKKNFSKAQNQSWFRGFLFGLKKSKKKTKDVKNRFNSKRKSYKKTKKSSLKNSAVLSKKERDKDLLNEIKYYRTRNLGVLYRDGKYYDTNFIDRPVEITKKQIKDLRSEYDWFNQKSDLQVANDFVHHMRRKYGVFDKKTGKFIGLLSEVKI